MPKKRGRRGSKTPQQAEDQPASSGLDELAVEKIFTGDLAVNHHNSRYLTDLPVADVDPSAHFSPKSWAPLKQMALGVVGSDCQKRPIVFIGAGKQVNADIYQELLREHVVSWVQWTY